jgi:cell division protein FtsN
VKDLGPEEMRRAAARRRAKSSAWRTRLFLQPPLEGGSKRWGWGVAGVVLLLLVTFISGVRVGKELNHPSPKKEAASFLKDRAGQTIPFRIEEAVKGSSRETEEKSYLRESVEKPKGKETLESKGKDKPAEEKESTPSKTGPLASSPAKSAPSSKAKYTLQVAALNSSEEAKELVNKLKSKGYEAYAITGSAAAKGALHRVRIGSFPTLQDARQFAVEFERKEKIKTIITSPNVSM